MHTSRQKLAHDKQSETHCRVSRASLTIESAPASPKSILVQTSIDASAATKSTISLTAVVEDGSDLGVVGVDVVVIVFFFDDDCSEYQHQYYFEDR
jgi:hypothetical protein